MQLLGRNRAVMIYYFQIPENSFEAFINDWRKVALEISKRSGFIQLETSRVFTKNSQYSKKIAYLPGYLVYIKWKSSEDIQLLEYEEFFNNFIVKWNCHIPFCTKSIITKDLPTKNEQNRKNNTKSARQRKIFLQRLFSTKVILTIAWIIGIIFAAIILFVR